MTGRCKLRIAVFAGFGFPALLLVVLISAAWGSHGMQGVDRSFSGDGRRLLRFGGMPDEWVDDLAVQRDGRIIVLANRAQSWRVRGIAVARLSPNGAPDPSFSGDGRRRIRVPGTIWAKAEQVLIQPDGRILIAGHAVDESERRDIPIVIRLLETGRPDPSFGRRGIRFLRGPAGDDSSSGGYMRSYQMRGGALALQRDGRIVVGGDRYGGIKDFQPWIGRLHPNGALDRSFAGRGWRTVDFGNGRGDDGFARVAVQGNGRIVALGSTFRAPARGRFAFARFLPGGALDRSFSKDGVAAFAVVKNGFNNAIDLTLDRRGRMVAAGWASLRSEPNSHVAVIRLTRRGHLDPTFSGDGRRSAGIGYGTAIDTDRLNRVVVAGVFDERRKHAPRHGTGNDLLAIRLRENGGDDRAFSKDGRKLVSFRNGKRFDGGFAVAVQPGHGILVGGESVQADSGSDAALVRLRSP